MINKGSASASNVDMYFYLSNDWNFSPDDVLLDSTVITTIDPNQIYNYSKNKISINQASMKGKYIIGIVDGSSKIPEFHEEDNQFSVLVQYKS